MYACEQMMLQFHADVRNTAIPHLPIQHHTEPSSFQIKSPQETFSSPSFKGLRVKVCIASYLHPTHISIEAHTRRSTTDYQSLLMGGAICIIRCSCTLPRNTEATLIPIRALSEIMGLRVIPSYIVISEGLQLYFNEALIIA